MLAFVLFNRLRRLSLYLRNPLSSSSSTGTQLAGQKSFILMSLSSELSQLSLLLLVMFYDFYIFWPSMLRVISLTGSSSYDSSKILSKSQWLGDSAIEEIFCLCSQFLLLYSFSFLLSSIILSYYSFIMMASFFYCYSSFCLSNFCFSLYSSKLTKVIFYFQPCYREARSSSSTSQTSKGRLLSRMVLIFSILCLSRNISRQFFMEIYGSSLLMMAIFLSTFSSCSSDLMKRIKRKTQQINKRSNARRQRAPMITHSSWILPKHPPFQKMKVRQYPLPGTVNTMALLQRIQRRQKVWRENQGKSSSSLRLNVTTRQSTRARRAAVRAVATQAQAKILLWRKVVRVQVLRVRQGVQREAVPVSIMKPTYFQSKERTIAAMSASKARMVRTRRRQRSVLASERANIDIINKQNTLPQHSSTNGGCFMSTGV